MSDTLVAELLRQGDFEGLFIGCMGWAYPKQGDPASVDDSTLRPVAVADKRGVTAWRVDCPDGLPKSSEQHRVVRSLKRLCRDQLVVFVSSDRHQWLWPEQRTSGVGYRLVRHEYAADQPAESLLQRLAKATFTLAEEEGLTSSEVLKRVRLSFNADKVTRSFYQQFQVHHKGFANRVEGLPTARARRWYASVLLNRLMFIYFIQQKGFLDGDPHYLRSRLELVRGHFGRDKFYAFFKEFLLPLFHEGLGSSEPVYADPEIEEIIGAVPYVNGGIFEPHDLEASHDIQIKDDAFEALFGFFDAWRWHLDEKPTGANNEINPDVLGFIFEQYINFTEAGQKENGAYYTKPDVTGYMAESTILPALADRFVEAGLDDPCLLLPGSHDAYIHDTTTHGAHEPMPEGWETGTLEPDEHLALPGERWCDIAHRRERCHRLRGLVADEGRGWRIDDAITENLDMGELLADYLTQLPTSEQCDTAFEALKSLTVCDATVGSGAFLFAALEVLDPLYEVVLDRAAELRDRNGSSAPARCLAEAERHPSMRYWTLKAICLNNLYGVDLMDEAPEIAKLRLFLKLAAQIDDVGLVEPLPDLDFNIKSGNLLVGIADSRDAETRFGAGQLDYEGEIGEIKAIAARVATVYDQFVQAQTDDSGSGDTTPAKQLLLGELKTARELADRLLHKKRREPPTATFEAWRDSSRPFHWFLEFPSVWRKNGFDVVIGNPPYIAAGEIAEYSLQGYKTQQCPDLYATCVERASTLVNEDGRMSMIVMHSLCFGKKLQPLRAHLEGRFQSLWVSSYSRIPGGLFSGSARVRNSIVVASNSPGGGRRTSSCRRWLTKGRHRVFDSIEYVKPHRALLRVSGAEVWPFVDSGPLSGAFGGMVERNEPIGSRLVKKSDVRLAYKVTAQYMLGVSPEPPPTRGRASTRRYGNLCFDRANERDLAWLMLVGRWGYLWWMAFSDEFDVTKGILAAFPGDVGRLCGMLDGPPGSGDDPEGPEHVRALIGLSETLQGELGRHVAWKKNAGIDVGRYNFSAPPLRAITDEADLLLARIWGVEGAYGAAGRLRDRTIFGNKE